MPEERYIQLIAKHLAGEASKDEEDSLNKWIAKPDNRKIYAFYEAMWCDTRLDYKSPRADKVFQLVNNNINETKTDLRANYTHRKKPPLSYFFAVAAVFVFLIISFFSLDLVSDKESSDHPDSPIVIERKLPKGQKMKIFLPDGSIVWLNAESKLRYPERFDGDQREIYLQGEAYFEVEANPEKPFIVKTDNLDVVALGTSFNVRDYKSENEVQVALSTGKVLVRSDTVSEPLVLDPGQGAFYQKNENIINKSKIDPNLFFLWKDGILYFKDAPFNEVFETLSQWYGVEFEFENQKDQKWFYTGRFVENEYLSNVLKSISYTKGFSYTIDQNKVLVKFKK